MKKENKNQIVIPHLMGNPAESKAIYTAGCPIRSGMTGGEERGHFTQHTQRGRSMVEMLGVLAIMGVLSVGGVAMYTTAMNKHRANELLNEASKRATIVAGQLLSNPDTTSMSLAQFGNNTVAGATFGENATISDNNITLSLSDVDDAICAQMQAALGDSTIMAVADDCKKITFNADMSRGVDASGGNGNDANLGEACDADNPCVDGCQECVNGHCQDKCTEGKVCARGANAKEYVCKAQPEGCSKCTSDEYCKITSSEGYCTNPDTGTCVAKESDFEALKKTINFGDSTLDVYESTNSMNWWTAKNWCEAHGKRMVSLADLRYSWHALESALVGELWVKDSYDSCYARYIVPGANFVDDTNRGNNRGTYALCK